MRSSVLLLVLASQLSGSMQEEGKIVRPGDGSVLPPGEISIVARAPEGKLELDGRAIPSEEPFPGVFNAKTKPTQGAHTLALIWPGGRKEIRFHVGDNPPAEFKPFRRHPPQAVACTDCHGLSSRGRFRFTGDCFGCHQQDTFPSAHQHTPSVLEQCGMCHNAHGSTAKAHLTLSRDQACKLCHN